MSRQHDSLRQDLERRLERGEISFDQYRFMLSELARSLAPPPAAAPLVAEDSGVFVSQGDWQTFLGEPDSVDAEEFAPPPSDAPSPSPRARGAQAAPAEESLEGTVVGNYRLERRVARGGMGEIWRAFDLVGERNVALKVLPRELKDQDEELQRVKKAFDRVQALQHQHICPIYQLDRHDLLGYFVVMKFLEAVTLSVYSQEFVRRYDAMSLDEAVRVLRPVAAALDYAHTQGIVHRDIKPQNVMVTLDGRDVQVVDFDLAAEVRGTIARRTGENITVSGTFSYMSPEQWKAGPLDGRSDQFALATVAYELLAGRLPFESPDPFVLRHCVLEDDPAPVAGLGQAPQQALLRALAKSPADRFSTCQEFIAALSGSASESPAETARSAPPPRRPAPVAEQNTPRPAASEETHSEYATFRSGGGSSRRERLLGLKPAPGAPPVRSETAAATPSKSSAAGRPLAAAESPSAVLNLASSEISSLSGVGRNLALQKLDISHTEVADLLPLAGVTHLRELRAANTPVANLIPLRNATGLRVLVLDQSRVEDLTPLRRMTNLVHLALQYTKVSDIAPLGFLMKLAVLDLTGTWVRDIGPLSMLKGLRSLALSRTLATDLEALSGLDGLQTLLLAGISAADFAPLSGLRSLRRLSLRGARFGDVRLLEGLADLRQLSLAGTGIRDCAPLAGLKKLQQLDLESTKIRDVAALTHLPELEWLSLKDCTVESVQPLHRMRALKHLDIRGMRLSLSETAGLRGALPGVEIMTGET